MSTTSPPTYSLYISIYIIIKIGPEYNETTTSGKNRTWVADIYYKGGFNISTNNPIQISNTNHPIIYYTYRLGQFKYEIPIPVGNYEIIIHFAEM
jgi:hypothetical protein